MIWNSKLFKILIVDDMPKNIQVVASILKNEGYQMTFARDGASALEKTEQIEFDLVLLDIMMPGMSGFEVCTRLKENRKTRELPIIFLSAKSDAASIVKGLELGAVDYINKPFNHAELKARVKTHLQMKQMRETLAQELATKDKFFSIIAHDLRNPFNHLLGYSEILIERYDSLESERRKEFIQTIYASLQNTFRLLENLLSWSRVQVGTIEWNPVTTNLTDTVNEAVELLSNQAASKHIRLESRLDRSLDVYADPNMLATVIRNLVSNALKFTHEGGEVWLEAKMADDRTLEVAVIDNGIGLSEENMQKLFVIGNQYSRAGTNDEKGTGLGLILCHEFVHNNKGDIWVESEVGKGSSFKFTVPLSTPAQK